ncbi:MAG: hypothetical protein ABI330_05640, partial [Caldimonas sp.]
QDFHAKVVAQERITTPAGEFDAYKVELSGFWRNEAEIGHGAIGRQYETYWYAPAAKRFVRREIKSYGVSIAKMYSATNYSRVDELTKFHLSPR